MGVILAVAAAVAYHPLHYSFLLAVPTLVLAVLRAIRRDDHGLVVVVGLAGFVTWVCLTGASFGHALVVGLCLFAALLLAEFLVYAGGEIKKMYAEQERLNEERRRRRVTEERLRIAAELHDVLGHHLSLINVRASVGRHLWDREPEEARDALDTIKAASAEALREVRAVLDTLYPTGETAPRAPAPGLDRLDELTLDAGLPVRTTVSGGPRRLPAEVDRAAYRIVQEALTNVRRHAGFGATAEVLVEYRPEEVVVQIDDDGAGRGPLGTLPGRGQGSGISGMRERAAALGGTLTAGPGGAGGWQVRALLPLPVDEIGDAEQDAGKEPEVPAAAVPSPATGEAR